MFYKPALFLILALVASGSSGLELAPIIAGVEQSVVAGSVEPLEDSRQELLRQLEAGSTPEARYLLAYVDWRLASMMMAEPEKLEEQSLKRLEEAQAHLEALIEARPEHAEAQALLSSVLGLQIGINAFRGMRLGPLSSAAVERAYMLEPSNPRVALVRGIGWLKTPRMFGGGVEKADAELQRAEELFQQESVDKAWPHWGRVDVLIWRGRVQAQLKNPDAARAFFEARLGDRTRPQMDPRSAAAGGKLIKVSERKRTLQAALLIWAAVTRPGPAEES